MNAFRRCMIFVTFVSSCFTIALLIASLGTNQWVNALAERTTNPHESEGKIHFGLFDGRKDLNVAYGWRTYEIDSKNSFEYQTRPKLKFSISLFNHHLKYSFGSLFELQLRLSWNYFHFFFFSNSFVKTRTGNFQLLVLAGYGRQYFFRSALFGHQRNIRSRQYGDEYDEMFGSIFHALRLEHFGT